MVWSFIAAFCREGRTDLAKRPGYLLLAGKGSNSRG